MAVRVPDGLDGREMQRRLLREQAIEIGGSVDRAASPVWRIGLMGVNATDQAATLVVEAFEVVLADVVRAGA